MKRITLLLIAVCFTALQGFAQVRPDITLDFNEAQQAELLEAIKEYINEETVRKHCDHMMHDAHNVLIHSQEHILSFHRAYVQGLEDYLLSKELYQFVPLPKWNPATITPEVFRTIDEDCPYIMCHEGENPNCFLPGTVANSTWYPNIPLPASLQLPGLCGFNESHTVHSLGNEVVPWHNYVHNYMGGVMFSSRAPVLPIFWLFHAYVDDVWKTWECNCPQSGLANTFDLYMKDTYNEVRAGRDIGMEPNIDNGPMWESEDIWIRTSNDGIANRGNQNPVYGQNNYVYVQVRNRGCVQSSGNNTLTLHWAKAGTNLSYPNHWDGSLQTTNDKPVGGMIGTVQLPLVKPGGSVILEFVWQPVNPEDYVNLDNSTDPLFWINEPEDHHFCLLAKIDSSSDPVTYDTQEYRNNLQNYVKHNNNIVWKNVSFVDVEPRVAETGQWLDDLTIGAAVFIGDSNGAGGVYDFEFTNPAVVKGNPVTAEAEVSVTLSNLAWQKWEDGGFQSENIKISREERNKVIVTGNPARLKNLTFLPKEFTLMSVGFNFLSRQVTGQTDFSYLAIQRNNADNLIVGGETYKIKVPGREGFYANAGGDRTLSEGQSTELNAYDIGEPAIYNWYDAEGNLVYTGQNFSVSPEFTQKYKLEVIATDGLKDYDEIEVKIKEFEILSMSPNPASSNVTINYKASTASSAYLMVTQPYGVSNNYILDLSQNSKTIDVSAYNTGMYIVALVCNGQIVDTRNLIIQ